LSNADIIIIKSNYDYVNMATNPPCLKEIFIMFVADYTEYVDKFTELYREWRVRPVKPIIPRKHDYAEIQKWQIMMLSAHPDDEAIGGGLAMRLKQELGFSVANVPITFGSKKERQSERYRELQDSCNYLGFKIILPDNGKALESVNLHTKIENPRKWKLSVIAISNIIAQIRPLIIFVPHSGDSHPSHIGSHHLLLDALNNLEVNSDPFDGFVMETEYWSNMQSPNLLVELGGDIVSDLITAISLHKGEVERNPYHLMLPATLMDNVRRGCESIGGKGSEAPDFMFAAIYRMTKFVDGELESALYDGKAVSIYDSLADTITVNQALHSSY
jgi:LmbE family N-acetylglucosaminyl deacetylase